MSVDQIPEDYWRELPCGHPPDPVAVRDGEGRPVCHCGWYLDQQKGVGVEGAPGPIVLCSKCGCHVAVPAPESPTERVERLEAELVDAEAAVERKRQEDGP